MAIYGAVGAVVFVAISVVALGASECDSERRRALRQKRICQ
jgi:hypothetical protein